MMLQSSKDSTRHSVTIDVKVTDVCDMTPCKQAEVYGRVFIVTEATGFLRNVDVFLPGYERHMLEDTS